MMKVGKILLRLFVILLVGFVVTFIFLSVMLAYNTSWIDMYPIPKAGLSAGISNALKLILFSIICTAGVGLIFWIPVWYGVGWVVLTISYGLVRATTSIGWIVLKITGLDKLLKVKPGKRVQKPKPQSKVSLTREERALLAYVKKARNKKMSDEQITLNLIHNGWTFDSIAAAFQMARNA